MKQHTYRCEIEWIGNASMRCRKCLGVRIETGADARCQTKEAGEYRFLDMIVGKSETNRMFTPDHARIVFNLLVVLEG